MLIDTLKKKKVRRSRARTSCASCAWRHARPAPSRQTVLHLLSNTQTSGIVLNRDYLHLSPR